MQNQQITTFLMFQGQAQEAMDFYISLFPNSRVVDITRYDASGPGKPGTIKHATFSLNGQQFMCIDSPVQHAFTFTPSISLYVQFSTEAELTRVFHELSKGGQILMPLDTYPFSKKFAWLNDRFGVSWQLTLTP